MNPFILRGRRGVGLIVVTASMAAVGLLGAALLSSITSTRYQSLHAGTARQAYYLAESGAAYVRAVRRSDPSALPAGTFTMENGDQFSILIDTNAVSGGILIESTGTVHPGTYFESQRRVRFVVMGGNPVLPLSFAELEKWIVDGALDPRLRSTGPSGHVLALDLKGAEGMFYLAWGGYSDLNLSSVWLRSGNVLSYDVQMKISPVEGGTGFGGHYMLGLSFRLNPDNHKGYGLSYFRSEVDRRPPAWVSGLPLEMQALRNGNVYLVLWYRDAVGKLELLNSRLLTVSDPVIMLDRGQPVLRPYSTMLLSLRDVVDAGGTRENHITAYMQGTSVYPLWPALADVDQAIWQENTNTFPNPVVWANGSVTQTNALVTSEQIASFSKTEGEVGVHVYYDNSGANKKYFADFAMRLHNPVSGGGGQIQY